MISNRIAQAENVIWRHVGDDIVVVKDDGRSLHVLNKTAALIWDTCDGQCGIDEITTRLCERFEVSHEEARRDVQETVKKLTKLGVLKNQRKLTLK